MRHKDEEISLREAEDAEVLSKLLGISKLMVMQTDLNQLLNLVMEEATELMDANRSTLYILDEDASELISFIAQKAGISEIRLPLGRGIAGHVAETGKIVNLPDAYESALFDREWDKRTGFRTRSVLCVPMRNARGKIIGALQVLNRITGVFSKSDEKILSMFASYAGIAIDNVRLSEDRELVFTSAIRALAEAVDRRDPATAGHSERVVYYAVKLGQIMDLLPEHLRVLEYAASLHDVGKIGVPDNILSKPDRLSDEEYEIMKNHASMTREILERFYFTGTDAEVPHVAACHHERLDGSGYPRGLRGDALPLTARILAVVDVYDALTSYDRPYRKAFTAEEAIAVLQEEAGPKFDARVVQSFVDGQGYVIERRRFVRLDLRVTIEYQILPRDRFDTMVDRQDAQTIDVSGMGLLFEAREFIPHGTFLHVTIRFPDYMIDVLAKVVRCDRVGRTDLFQVAIVFLGLLEEMQKKLQGYLVDVSRS